FEALCHTAHLYSRTKTAPTHLYPLSLHDALPISPRPSRRDLWRKFRSHRNPRTGPAALSAPAEPPSGATAASERVRCRTCRRSLDRKSTRLNSSHVKISYAVLCLKKKKKNRDSTS